MKKILLNSVILFILGFVIHLGGDVFGDIPILTYFFPKDETIFEHSKLYTTGVLFLVIIYFVFRKQLKTNEILKLLIGLTIMLFLNVTIFTLLQHVMNGHNMVVTLIVYFLILFISQFIVEKLFSEKNRAVLKIIVLLILISLYIIVFTHI